MYFPQQNSEDTSRVRYFEKLDRDRKAQENYEWQPQPR